MNIIESMMSQRQEALIISLINEYIDSGIPVSSKLLEKTGFFGLSSATIRAEMNDLETAGYLSQFHTSGGRVPTDRAYRHFVNNLIENEDYEIDPSDQKKIKTTLAGIGHDPREINRVTAHLISELSDNMVFAGTEANDDFYKTGISSLLEFPEFQEIDRIFQLTSFFDEFENMFNMIQHDFAKTLKQLNPEFSISIGRENPIKNIKRETVIMAKYQLPQRQIGSITLVGPMRMDYRRNLGLVKCATEELNKIAKQS